MKRLRAAIICVCMLSVFLGGCGQTKTVTGETAKTDGTAPTGSAAADSLTVEPYQIGTGTSAFTERIDENPLDTAYEKERQSAVTTQDFCAVEEKYAQLWEAELQRSLDDLNGYLTAGNITSVVIFTSFPKIFHASALLMQGENTQENNG